MLRNAAAGRKLLDGKMIRSIGGLPTYWSKNPNLSLASQVEPSEEEKGLYIKLFHNMVALGAEHDSRIRRNEGRLLKRLKQPFSPDVQRGA